VRKLLRTLQIHLPGMLDAKFSLMRRYRNALKRPFEDDFNALCLFPDVDGALFLDVGANRGQSTDAILMTRRNPRIELFEPNEFLFGKLKALYGGNPKVAISNFGLGNEDTDGVLYVPFYRKWMFDGLASFEQSTATEWLRDRVFFYRESLLTVQESRCRIRKLDALNLAPFLIKLDIQGYEYRALQGAEKTLKGHEPVLLIETPGREIVSFLAGLRYEPYAYRGGKLVRGAAGALNTFFMTPAKARLVENHIVGAGSARGSTGSGKPVALDGERA